MHRYTIVRSGDRRLYVPNSAFLTREFMVVDDPEAKSRQRQMQASSAAGSNGMSSAAYPHAYVLGPDGHPRWMGAVPTPPYDSRFMNSR